MVIKDKYEISLWEDYLVPAIYTNDKITTPEYYDERKIAIIGSDTMTAQCRALEPRLVENINGTNTLTFKMHYTYYDNITGEKTINPFISLMVNERKVKAYWKNKWYDLVIKGIQEDSNGKSITYTCKDLFIKELSKTGFNLEFDNELENNQGTAQELGERILEGTDWSIDVANSDIIPQKRQEAVYEILIPEGKTLSAKDENGNTISVTGGKTILVFYSVVQNRAKFFQFLYSKDSSGIFKKDSSTNLVQDAYNLSVDNVTWTERKGTGAESEITFLDVKLGQDSSSIISISTLAKVSDNYRGERLVRSQKQSFNSALDRYVYEYVKDGKTYYGFSETVYRDPTYVNNLLANTKNFSDSEGWSGGSILFKMYPPYNKSEDYSATTYLGLAKNTDYMNCGIGNSLQYLPNGFQKGEKFIARVKLREGDKTSPNDTYFSPLNGLSNSILNVCRYTEQDGTYTKTEEFFSSSFIQNTKDNWIEYLLTCETSVSKESLRLDNIDFFINCGSSADIFWLEDIEFFPRVLGENNERINHGEMDKASVVSVSYKYYDATQKDKDSDNIEYAYSDYEEWQEVTPVYNDNFEKIRSISGKNSNRFNLLQTVAETFECWVGFNIEHDDSGKIVIENGKPKKFVKFVNEIGQRTNIGFKYGIDLNSISRTINSDQIITKTIVVDNSNEYAKDGFCSIARSDENYAKDTFILNFDYYVSQGLLSLSQINKDLYHSDEDAIGYYYHLRQINTQYDALTEELVAKKDELTKKKALLETYEEAKKAAATEVSDAKTTLLSLTGKKTISKALSFAEKSNTQSYIDAKDRYNILVANKKEYDAIYKSVDKGIVALEDLIEDKTETQKNLKLQKEELDQKFYSKYSRFIEEGSWISEDYTDDNLYYLDALSVGYTSSRPQISYNISVLRLSALEEFKNKVFRLGDISYVEDTEFFGYTIVNGIKTPYKEEVLISEIVSNFDSPEKDSFKVQNYKTQFEDLFQRITATTQSLQYNTGEYQRAANAFTSTGELNPYTLQNSLILNQDLVISSQSNSFVQDNTGISLVDKTNPNKRIKINANGIFLSIDGGLNWKSAITGEGISSNYLTAGSINVNNITILDGTSPSFRWDSSGLNAYYSDEENGLYFNKFVRMDKYGFYGMNGYSSNSEDGFSPNNEDDVWEKANFGLTWKGFFLRNKTTNGGIEISSEKDFVIYEDDIERIKIGRLGTIGNEEIYGIRIKNYLGNTVLESVKDGSLWIKDRLNIGTENSSYEVGIGNLGKKNENSKNEVINANDKFIVYEDGSIEAKEGSFTGKIEATGGTIGGMSIEQFADSTYVVRIESDRGTVINSKDTRPITLTAKLFKGGNEITSGLKYQWKEGDLVISNATQAQYVIKDFSKVGDITKYSCAIELIEGDKNE